MKTIRIIFLFTLATSSFAHAEPVKRESQKVEEEVRDRAGARVVWERTTAAREENAAIVRKLLRGPLTVADAVQIALLNNRSLQATFEEIGIARADVIESVTLPNPAVDFDVQFPVVAGEMNRYGWLVAQEFVQMLMIPLKKRIAGEQLEAAELRVADEVLQLIANVKKAYFVTLAGQQLLSRLQIIQESNSSALALGQKQFEAGNTTDRALLQLQAAYDQGRLDIAKAESDLRGHREELNRLLGLWGAQIDWRIPGELPPMPDADSAVKRLESLAVAQRLDLRAAHRQLTSVVSALGLSKVYRWVPVLDFGFSGERDIDGALNMGPAFRLEVPIFNQGQARLARAESELRRAENRLEALAIEIRSDVRKFRDRLVSLRQMAGFYHDELLPTRRQLVNRTLLQYNAMQVGPYELFQARAEELEAEREYIETLRDYWITRAELERTVGGTLTPRNKSLVAEGKTTQP